MRRPPIGTRDRGFSLLELQVAFIVFGIALGGLGPVVFTHQKQVKKLEDRMKDGAVTYIVPRPHAWARKLGSSAAILSSDPGDPVVLPPAAPKQSVIVLSIDRSLTEEAVTVHTSVGLIP